MTPSYEPFSSNAQFATIIERLGNQDAIFSDHRAEIRSMFRDFKSELGKTDKRVDTLEREKWTNRGFIAAIGLAIPLAWQWITSPHTPKP